MSNFLQDIETVLRGEEVVAFAWQPNRGDKYNYPTEMSYFTGDWDFIKHQFDYDYNSGFGLADCHAILLWTPTRVIFVAEYDGSTSVESLPLSYNDMTASDMRFV